VASVPTISRVLTLLGERLGRHQVSIVGHSLGNRGLIRALERPPETDERFRDLILIAADVDRARFREVLPTLNQHIEDVTILVSDRDLPLRASQIVNRAPRLGQAQDIEPEWMSAVQVIDVSDIEATHLSGHIYHLRNDQIIDRIRSVLVKTKIQR
jgi:esterase/lipase superfamily enzyme